MSVRTCGFESLTSHHKYMDIIIACKVESGKSSTTKKELVKALAAFPDDAIIQTEGCDCYGDAVEVRYDPKSNEILIARYSEIESILNITPSSDDKEATVVANEPLILLPEPKNLGDLE